MQSSVRVVFIMNFVSSQKKFGKEKTYLHIHHHVMADPEYDEIFGNIIAVSEFAKKEWLRTTKQKKTGAHVVYNCVNEAKFNKKNNS